MVLVCLRLGAAPLRNVEFDVTPVDYVAKAIAELSLRNEAFGQNYHLTNPNPLQTKVLTDWMEHLGVGVEVIPYEEWRDRMMVLAEELQTQEIRLLGDILGPRVLAEDDARAVHPRFDCQRTLNALANTDIRCAPADERLLTTYFEYIQQSAGHALIAD